MEENCNNDELCSTESETSSKIGKTFTSQSYLVTTKFSLYFISSDVFLPSKHGQHCTNCFNI